MVSPWNGFFNAHLVAYTQIRSVSFHMFVFFIWTTCITFLLYLMIQSIFPTRSAHGNPVYNEIRSSHQEPHWQEQHGEILPQRCGIWSCECQGFMTGWTNPQVGEQHVFLCWWHPPILRWWNWWKYVRINSCYFLWWTQCLCLPCNCFHWFS
jgi:hypothetical protein